MPLLSYILMQSSLTSRAREPANQTLQPIELIEVKICDGDLSFGASEQLQKLGYEVEVDPRTGAPEIRDSGVSGC